MRINRYYHFLVTCWRHKFTIVITTNSTPDNKKTRLTISKYTNIGSSRSQQLQSTSDLPFQRPEMWRRDWQMLVRHLNVLTTNMWKYAVKINMTKPGFVFFYSPVYRSIGSLFCMGPPDLIKNDTNLNFGTLTSLHHISKCVYCFEKVTLRAASLENRRITWILCISPRLISSYTDFNYVIGSSRH